MTESIKWNRTKQLTKDQFCELTRTPEDWHIFKECDRIEFYEYDYLGRTYWRCDTKDILWIFTKVDGEIWFKTKDRYDHGPYWSEWHDWA